MGFLTCEDYVDSEDDGDDEYNDDNSDIEMVGCTERRETIQHEAILRLWSLFLNSCTAVIDSIS